MQTSGGGFERLLVANRGEVVVRVMRAARELGLPTVAVFAADDADAGHITQADEAVALAGTGPAAYLDGAQLVAVAVSKGCDAVHPGYGFLSEDASFARRCIEARLTFVGPTPDVLELLGDKVAARALAQRCQVPVLAGTSGPTDVDEARAFLASLGQGQAMMIKAVAGGGGRGMRVVRRPEEVSEAWARCRSEARRAFGRDDVYVEQLLEPARHVEVQIAGDGHGTVSQLGERDCTLQRRHQKLVEVAPCAHLAAAQRDALLGAGVRMAAEVGYGGLGTFEFLVPLGTAGADDFAFIEANARLQVEHTVTEEVTGIDLVVAQLGLAAGRTLAQVGLAQDQVPAPRGTAVQVRVNAERMTADGVTHPAGGTIRALSLPAGPGVRVDSAAAAGATVNPSFDSLLAKVVAHSALGWPAAADKTDHALGDLRIEGVPTNTALLRRLLRHPDVVAGRAGTNFVEEHLADLLDGEPQHEDSTGPGTDGPAQAGARIDSDDPLAVLAHGRASSPALEADAGVPGPEHRADGTVGVEAPMQGTVVELAVAVGDSVRAGQPVAVMEAMKMEHVVAAASSGIVRRVAVAPGDTVYAGHPLVFVEAAEVEGGPAEDAQATDPDRIRPDLAEVVERHAFGFDAARPEAVARRRRTGQRTARENVDDLCDPGSFVEYGPLVIAARRQRQPVDELIRRTPADGLVAGIGTVNGGLVDPARARCAVVAYDYTVLAGTQGFQNHRKKDRMFELAAQQRLPLVLFAEGGGGRPGDSDATGVAGLDVMAFHLFGRLSGLVPLIGITSGRCFAGNAALLGCCDVVIATRGSNIGMGGPAMIEGGGLGVFRPEEIGPMDVQVPNGVVDVAVEDEAEAVRTAKQYLSYFQGPVADWQCADQRRLRAAIPENRLRTYDVRAVIDTLADTGSVLELRRAFGSGMVTALARIEGRPVGIIANNPVHLGGAIDRDGADKAARFMQLCDAFAVPLLLLCDTPGIMVGPETEKTALVRHVSRLFVIGANLSVPFFTIVLRKAYGLGAQAMAGGSFKAPAFVVSWPTGEFGGMGLEGAVKLGFRNELAALTDPGERKARFEAMVAQMYERGKAVNTASHFELDDVIDPVDSRRWITTALRSAPSGADGPADGRKRRPAVDTW